MDSPFFSSFLREWKEQVMDKLQNVVRSGKREATHLKGKRQKSTVPTGEPINFPHFFNVIFRHYHRSKTESSLNKHESVIESPPTLQRTLDLLSFRAGQQLSRFPSREEYDKRAD